MAAGFIQVTCGTAAGLTVAPIAPCERSIISEMQRYGDVTPRPGRCDEVWATSAIDPMAR